MWFCMYFCLCFLYECICIYFYLCICFVCGNHKVEITVITSYDILDLINFIPNHIYIIYLLMTYIFLWFTLLILFTCILQVQSAKVSPGSLMCRLYMSGFFREESRWWKEKQWIMVGKISILTAQRVECLNKHNWERLYCD